MNQIISEVNAALASLDRGTMLTLEAQLDQYNNLESPFCAGVSPSPTPRVTATVAAATQTPTPSPAPGASSPTQGGASGLPNTGGAPVSAPASLMVLILASLLIAAGATFVTCSRRGH
ncbi:MAG: hypothetical protein AAB092_06635 [Chloroflexota bacterium]